MHRLPFFLAHRAPRAVVIGVLVAIAASSFGFAAPAAHAAGIEDWTFMEAGDGTAVVTGYVGAETDVTIPSTTALGSVVTSIASSAFQGSSFTSVVIPSSVRSIGDRAFQQSLALRQVAIPMGVQWIGHYAFYQVPLESVTIPSSVTNMGIYAFASTALTSVVIQPGMTTIPAYAFSNTPLTSVTIPAGVRTIESSAFASTRLTSVTIPSGVTSIEQSAFAYSMLTSVDIPDGVTSIGPYAFTNNPLTAVIIPGSVATIGREAFAIAQLTSLVVPEGVTEIGVGAFYFNPELASITLPTSLKVIGSRAFAYSSARQITLPANLTSLSLTNAPANVAVDTFGDRTFYGWGTTEYRASLITDGGESLLGVGGTIYALSAETDIGWVFNNGTTDHTEHMYGADEAIVAPAGPARPGYVVRGWSLTADGSTGLVSWLGSTDAPNTTVYAQWRLERAISQPEVMVVGSEGILTGVGFEPGEAVSFAVAAGHVSVGSAVADSAGEIATTVTLPAGTAAGATTIEVVGSITGISLESVTARWPIVTMDPNDGVSSSVHVDAPFDALVPQLVAPTKALSRFIGWFRGSAPWSLLTDRVMLDTALTAHWEARGVVVPASVSAAEAATVKGHGFEPGEQVTIGFAGGSPEAVTADAAGLVSSRPVAPVTDGLVELTVSGSVTGESRYGIDVVAYDVTFMVDGSVHASTELVAPGAIVDAPGAPTRHLERFTGWFDGATRWDFVSDIVTEDVTLTAHWEARGVVAASTVSAGKPLMVTGYGFEPGESVIVGLDGGVLETATASPSGTISVSVVAPRVDAVLGLHVTGSVTGTSQYGVQVIAHELTLKVGDKTFGDVQLVAPGDLATAPTAPVRDSARFLGWLDSNGEPWEFDKRTVDADVVLTASFEQRKTVVPEQVAHGGTFTVSGSGFEPFETVRVVMHSTPTLLAELIADAHGDVNANVSIPADKAAGMHELEFTGSVTGVSAQTFEVKVQEATGGEDLASTGASVALALCTALALVLAGAGMLAFVTGRRRRRA